MSASRHEWRLINQAREGNADAFTKLALRYLEALYRYLYFRLGNEHEAEAFVTTVLVKAWELIPDDRLSSLHPFVVWLLRVSDYVLRDTIDEVAYVAQEHRFPPLFRWSPRPGASDLPKLESRDLSMAIRRLDSLYQQVLVLRYLLRLSPKEVAQIIGDSESGVRVLQYRALIALREVLTRQSAARDLYTNELVEKGSFCLDKIIALEADVAGCIRHVADPYSELEETLQFALMVVDARIIEIRQNLRSETGKKLIAALRKSGRRPKSDSVLGRIFPDGGQFLVVPLIAVIATLLLTGGALAGAVLVANQAIPGDALYRIDLGLEQRYLATLDSPGQIAQFQLRLTEERIVEIEDLASYGDLQDLQIGIAAYSRQLGHLSQTLQQGSVNVSVPALNQTMSGQERRLDSALALAASRTGALPNVGGERETICAAARPGRILTVGSVVAHEGGASYDQIMEWYCEGHDFGSIVFAVATSKTNAVSPEELLRLQREAKGWAAVWQQVSADSGDGVGE